MSLLNVLHRGSISLKYFSRRNLVVSLFISFCIGFWVKFGHFFESEISRASKDNRSIINSKFLGREIRIAPFLKLVKLKDYSGWPDKYYYVLSSVPRLDVSDDLDKIIELKQIEVFKVVDVRFKKANFPIGSSFDKSICLIQSPKFKNLIATIECNDLSKVDELAEIFSSTEFEIKKNGYALISTEKYAPSNSKLIYKVNNFNFYKLTSLNELKLLFYQNEDDTNPSTAEYLMYRTFPFLIKKEDGLNEKSLSILFKNSKFGYLKRQLGARDGSFRDEFLKNQIPKEIDDWIIQNFQNSINDRWALRVFAGFFYRQLLSDEKLDGINSRERFFLVEEVSDCLAKFFDKPDNSKFYFNNLKSKILENKVSLKKYDEISFYAKEPIEGSYNYSSGGCTDFSPPEKQLDDPDIFY